MEDDLRAVLNKHSVILEMLEQLVNCVYFMHQCGTAHGDLSPNNIMVESLTSYDGLTSCKVTIIDLGVQVLHQKQEEQSNSLFGGLLKQTLLFGGLSKPNPLPAQKEAE